MINTYEWLSFQKHFKTGSCDSPKYEVLDIYIWRNLTQVYSFFTNIHIQKQTIPASLYQYEPQAAVQKSETNIFDWVILSTISYVSNIWTSFNLYHVVHLLYAKICAYILNECNLTFPWHVKNLLVSTGKNKRIRRYSVLSN